MYGNPRKTKKKLNIIKGTFKTEAFCMLEPQISHFSLTAPKDKKLMPEEIKTRIKPPNIKTVE